MAKSRLSVSWFEIPVKNMKRAVKFYSAALRVKFVPMEAGGTTIHAFMGAKMPIGALIKDPTNKPSKSGSILYFETSDVKATLKRVAKAGGKVVLPAMSIGDYGTIGQFTDTEGNRIALHAS
ncbi:MAG: VOC family protein [Alphaproteobacteria bacterium]|nr:VOC family protein [Alphaproteobacteria bacterium]